ncbi:heat shock protein 60 [Emiliania huxleyi CCMP1516]|uniref:Uncharacterized protein n=2 Tax=Emiliania huxleyi TaxID=2903 RepID=A0A0D3K066_EMIH1|nr:heat shock protein 60 [Emiliania huxleyi CCMP1516]EOD29151.1 heat shock protein 60 [Emiliania huxleyi CCMP1516]|eukprot:XP_005781580.1 heat shock protein 60 [Emiliania huxleyi CCMP1516]
MATEVTFGDESRAALLAGIDAVANAVKVTIGPKGRNVVLERSFGVPEVVNDGVTIARDIELEDARANVGAKLIVEVASKSDQKAGDGTTTSCVLTQALVGEGLKLVASGANPIALQRGLQKAIELRPLARGGARESASKLLAAEVKKLAKPVDSDDEIKNIAAMGRTIATCFQRDGQTLTDEIDFTEGMEIDRGFVSPYFVKNQASRSGSETQLCELENPRVLVTDRKIGNMQERAREEEKERESRAEIVPLLEGLVSSKEPLLIIAEDALSSLVLNKMRGVLDVCAIKPPSFGDRRKSYLEDIAIVTGATFVTEQLGLTLESASDRCWGEAAAPPKSNHADEVGERIKVIRAEAELTDSQFDKEKAEERIAKLGGAIGRIKVGAATETELKDKKLRYEDALNSVKAAMNEGIVPGGGATLVYCLRFKEQILEQMTDEDEKLAVDILFRAMTPLSSAQVKAQEWGFGWNAATGEYEDLLESGVIDPATVTQQAAPEAVLNSCSIAASVLTTQCLITEIKEEGPPMAPGMDDGMGMM